MKRLIRVLVFFISVLSFYLAASANEGREGENLDQVTIYILSTGDIHEAPDNLKNISACIERMRDKYGKDSVLLFDAGDMLSAFTPETKGDKYAPKRTWALDREKTGNCLMYDWVAKQGYDAMVLGNHDFIGGIDLLKRYENNLPFVCTNLEYLDFLPGKIPQYRIINKGEVRIGIIGISRLLKNKNNEEVDPGDRYHFPSEKEAKDLKAYTMNDECMIKTINKVLGEIPDLIVILSHNKDGEDKDSIAEYMKVHTKIPFVIIGGHTHEALTLVGEDSSYYLVKSGKEGQYVGMTIVVWNRTEKKLTNVKVGTYFPDDIN